LLAAWVVVPHGQAYLLWFTLLAFGGIVLLARVGGWYQTSSHAAHSRAKIRDVRRRPTRALHGSHRTRVAILGALIFSKYFYLTSLTSYYTFYLISKFGVSVSHAQIYLFVFSFRRRGRHDHRWSGRRPYRPEICDLGVDSRPGAVHAGVASRGVSPGRRV